MTVFSSHPPFWEQWDQTVAQLLPTISQVEQPLVPFIKANERDRAVLDGIFNRAAIASPSARDYQASKAELTNAYATLSLTEEEFFTVTARVRFAETRSLPRRLRKLHHPSRCNCVLRCR